MISSLAWVPRGKAKAVPTKYEPTEEELEEMRQAAKEMAEKETGDDEAGDDEEWEDMDEDEVDEEKEEKRAAVVQKAQKAARAATSTEEAFGLDDYDNEPADLTTILGKGYSKFNDNSQDPYITLPDEDDDSEEEDDNVIRPTDGIILACHSEEDGHTLEVYVFDYARGSLFVHHDLMLNAFPLSVAWLDTARKDGGEGSFVALGTMDTAIEVWDLDCIDSLVPAAVLGGEDATAETPSASTSKGKKKKKNAKQPLKEGSHKEAVLGLSWNKHQRHILSSSSADKTVKIWDVPNERCLHTLTHHSDKVQALQWHPTEAAVLLTGSFDRHASVLDVRATAADWRAAAKFPVSSDVECVSWDPHTAHQFLVSTDDGTVTAHDARYAGKAPVFTIGAHSMAVTGLALNPRVPGLLATCSLDKTVKLWDMRGGRVDYLLSRGMDVGQANSTRRKSNKLLVLTRKQEEQVFTCGFCDDPELGYVLAAGGKEGKLAVWDTASTAVVRDRFPTGKTADDYLPDDVSLAGMSLTGGAGGGAGRDSDDDSDEEMQAAPPAPVAAGAAKPKPAKKTPPAGAGPGSAGAGGGAGGAAGGGGKKAGGGGKGKGVKPKGKR